MLIMCKTEIMFDLTISYPQNNVKKWWILWVFHYEIKFVKDKNKKLSTYFGDISCENIFWNLTGYHVIII